MSSSTPAPVRVRFFIDGFNVYHSLKKHKKFLWLNYRRLAELIIRPYQVLEGVYYFTAIAHWLEGPARRHQVYLRALEAEGVEKILGKFKPKTKHCAICKGSYKGHEEKETDVNLAIHLVKGAMRHEFDTAILVTGDTDLIPAIKMAKKEAPTVRIGVLLPYNRGSFHLEQVADFKLSITKYLLRNSQLLDPYTLPDGTVLRKPANWV